MVDAQARPQLLEHLQKSLTVTIHSTRHVICLCVPPAAVLLLAPACACMQCMQRSPSVHRRPHRWVPGTARFVAVGTYARDTGCLQVGAVGAFAFVLLACLICVM